MFCMFLATVRRYICSYLWALDIYIICDGKESRFGGKIIGCLLPKRNYSEQSPCKRSARWHNLFDRFLVEHHQSLAMDSDDEIEETSSWKGVSSSIILININDSSKTTATMAHKATCRLVRQYLRLSSSHHLAVCLYGTEDSNSSAFGIKTVIDVFPLSAPSLDDYKVLRNIDVLNIKPAKELKLSDVLWHCSKMFANCKKQLSTKSVIMLTPLDTPPDVSDQKPTLKRVVDLVDSDIDIRIVNIANEEYKVDPFYINFLIEANKGKGYTLPTPMNDAKEIENIMYSQTHRHLAVARLNFEIADGMSIGVGLYSLLKRSGQYYQKKVDLDIESNSILNRMTKTTKITPENNSESPMDVDGEENEPKHGVPILKSEILHYQIFGEQRIEFTDDEKKKIKNPFGPPMIKLLGFKPASILCKEKWYLKPAQFLFPSENLIEGSTVALKALHQACVETSMVAICVLCSRVNSRPNIVALAPCTYPLGLDVEIGFDVIQIPFIENVRDVPNLNESENINITNQQKAVMKEILKNLQFDYKAEMFENPKLQSEYRACEAIALEDDDVEPFVDCTKPSSEKFQGIDENLFQQLFGPFAPVATKRPPASGEPGSSSKRPNTNVCDETQLQHHIRNRTVHKYKVDELKTILKSKDNSSIPALTGLKKDKLVELVYKYCD